MLQDHRRLRRAPHLILSDRVQRPVPAAGVRPGRADVHRDNPTPEARRLARLLRAGRARGTRRPVAGPGPGRLDVEDRCGVTFR